MIKLGDFGLAVDLNDYQESQREGEVARKRGQDVSEGDASYLAPELLSFNAKVTKKIDIFSFGLSLIELFNIDGIDKLPQNGPLWTKLREHKPSTFIQFLYPELGNLIDKMTCKNVEERYSIDDVLNHKYVSKFYNKKEIPKPQINKVSLHPNPL